ncbi:MAG: hypothetical protein LBM65_04590 [Oscillospiraceae bacterium]|nr:hypothetical protein [Oscillospiraceae bacterium]
MKKFLKLLPLILCFAFTVFFYLLFSAQENTSIRRALLYRSRLSAMVAGTVDFINEHLDESHSNEIYTKWLVDTSEQIDQMNNTLGLVADKDLKVLSNRFNEGEEEGNVFSVEDIKKQISTAQKGDFEITYPGVTIMGSFRWIDAKWNGERYLLITGTSPERVSGLDRAYVIAAALLVLFTVVCNYILILKARKYTPIELDAACKKCTLKNEKGEEL